MTKRRIIFAAMVISLVALFVSCNMDISQPENSSSDSGTANKSTYTGTVTVTLDGENKYPDTYNESDYDYDNYDFGTEYTFNVSTGEWAEVPDEAVISYTAKTSSLKITNLSDNAINIKLTGSNDSFKVTVDGNEQPVKVTLSSVSLTSADRVLNVKNSSVTYLYLEGDNSMETLINSEDKNVLKSASDLIIGGNGSLSVTANSKNGIVTDGVLCIKSGTINVTVAAKTYYTNVDDTAGTSTVEETKGTAIKPMLGFVMLGGDLTIYGNNSDKGYESKGIKVDGFEADTLDDESDAAGMGWIVIDGGNITIKTQGKAISAGWKESEDDKPTSSSNYPVPDVYINGGTFNITTYATPRDDTSTVDGVSPEGIEAKHNMYITGGTFVINTTDDCLNASNAIYISGGLIYAKASNNDAIDAGAEEDEGYLYISGGALIAMGSSQPETGLDCNSNSRFQYTGGIIVAMGGGQNNAPNASGTSAYTATTGNARAGSTYALVQDGEVVLAFTVPSGYSSGSSVLLGSGELATGSATLISGASVSASNSFNNALYYGTVSASGGTATSVTVSNSSSSGGIGGGMGGGQPRGRF